MKWIELNKARQLKFNEPVIVKDAEGVTMGKLIEKKHTEKGIVHTFEVALFSDKFPVNGDPVYSMNVTHIAIPS